VATTAVRFDASGDRLRISSGLWDYNAAYTFAAWVYISTDRATNYQSIFCRYGSGSMMDQVYVDASMRIATFISNSASTDTTGATLTTGTWYYVACVRESNASFKVYIDGSATATIADTRSVSGRTDVTPLLDISTNAYTEWYNGRMAFTRLWTVALSNAEINAEMDSLTAVKTASLWGDWPLQTDDDDDSGNARHFTTAGTVTYSEAGPDIASGPTYTLTAAQGAYTLTGQAMTPKAARLLTAAQGTYTLTGQAMTPKAGRLLTAAQGAYTLTGQAAALTVARLLTAAQGAYTLTGQAMLPKAARLLTAAQGSYTLTGYDVTLTYSGEGAPTYTLTAAQGAYTLTGQAATLAAARLLTAAQGAYTLTGQAAALTVARLLTAGQGSYTLTGYDVTLTYSGEGAPTYTLTAAQGAYTLTGYDAGLMLARLLLAVAGAYTLTGYPAVLTYSGEGVTTRAGRIYVIIAEDRTLVVEAEDRTFVVGAEARTYSIQ
jgi:hypothetical protein